jgi:hypothetical protein
MTFGTKEYKPFPLWKQIIQVYGFKDWEECPVYLYMRGVVCGAATIVMYFLM